MLSTVYFIFYLFFLIKSILSQTVFWTSENALTLLNYKMYSTWKDSGNLPVNLYLDEDSGSTILEVDGTQTTVTFHSIIDMYYDYTLSILYICPGDAEDPGIYRYTAANGLTKVDGDPVSSTTISCVFIQEMNLLIAWEKQQKIGILLI